MERKTHHIRARQLISRRAVLMGTGGVLMARPAMAALLPTPDEIDGPFYPVRKPQDSDIDLTQIAGRTKRAKGDVIEVQGRLLLVSGAALADMQVELWQANAFGDYAERTTGLPPRSDPDFQGFGAMKTDKTGAFRFHTIKPAAYDLGGGQRRTPHIHFMVRAKGQEIFTTQMYFPGEPLNKQDMLLIMQGSKSRRDRLTSRQDKSVAGRYLFDIVLK